MRDLAQSKYTAEEARKKLKGHREIKFEYQLLSNDERTIGVLPKANGSINFDSSCEIMGSGNFDLLETELNNINIVDEKIMPFFCLKMGEEWLKYPLGIYLLSSPVRFSRGGKVYRKVDAYDKSIVLKEDKITERLTVLAGSNYVEKTIEILNLSGIGKVDIAPSLLTNTVDIEFEIGTSKIEIINTLLKAINYVQIHFDSLGYARSNAYIEPSSREVEEDYTTDKDSIVLEGAEQSLDLYSVPNKIVRYISSPEAGEMTSTYLNDDAGNKLSTVNRGRTVVDIEVVNDIADQETLNALTRRVAIEKSQVFEKLIFKTAIMPHHSYEDCLMVLNSQLGIASKYIEKAWSIDLEIGGAMTHKCRKAVKFV